MKIICGWCQADLGEKYPNIPGISHGICEECKAKILAEHSGQSCSSSQDGAGGFLPPFPSAPRPLFHRKVKCKK